MGIIEEIRRGKIDCNNQSLFFSILVKGLILELNKELKIRDINIPHIIINTGDDFMYLDEKGYDNSKEPLENTNENYVYNIIPRCNLSLGGISLPTDQLSSPYSRGVFELQTEDNVYNISAEFRRIPLTLSVNLKYYTDTFTDMLELTQQLIAKLSFIRTFNITYMGQQIKCSYSLPDSFDRDFLMDLDGMTQDNKYRTMELSIDVASNFPVFDNKTAVSTGDIITNLSRDYINGNNVTGAYDIYDKKTKTSIKS